MKYNIYISNIDLTTVIDLPILPETLPEIVKSLKSEEFETYDNGSFNFIANVGLETFSLERFFPEFVGKYDFEQSKDTFDGFKTLIDLAYENKTPVRVIFSTSSTTILDDTFTVETFSYYVDSNGDYQFKADFKQYRAIK